MAGRDRGRGVRLGGRTRYAVRDRASYDRALTRQGDITVRMSPDAVAAWRVLPALAPAAVIRSVTVAWVGFPPGSEDQGMECIGCGSAAVTERPERTARGYRRFRCRDCGKQSNERSGGSLNHTHYPSDVIALVVLWRLRYH